MQFAWVERCTSRSGTQALISATAPISDTITASTPVSFRNLAYSPSLGISSLLAKQLTVTCMRFPALCIVSEASARRFSSNPAEAALSCIKGPPR